jgi:sigma-B regulation protein RsbU (phosphoserine phosphatase)
LEYSRAGHNPPYLIRAGAMPAGTVQTLDAAGGLPLGILKSVTYDTAAIQLEPGDRILLFTDGITEAMNPARELYGEDRLERLLEQSEAASIEELVRTVTDAATAFADGAPASDDITVMGICYRGKG